MTNNYEKPEAAELGKAQNEIRSQKPLDTQTDSLGVPMRAEPELDDFDE